MHDYTLRIADSDKAIALLNYLKTLDFVEITKANDWWDDLSKESKENIQLGLNDFELGNTHSDEDVRKSIHKRILDSKV